ncbi:helix-turn-helix domain-containing protein [Corynebacterium kalidii]
MEPQHVLTTQQVAEVLGIDRSRVVRRVRNGSIPTVGKLPGRTGAHLFDPDVIDALAHEEGARA